MSADERTTLASGPMILGVAFALGMLLAAVLPTKLEYAKAADDPSPDAYTLAYLSVLTRASPNDDSLRMVYVRHLATLSRFDEALDALAPALGERTTATASGSEAANLRLDLLLARARAAPQGSAEGAAAFARVAQELAALRKTPQTAGRLRQLASLALELERPHLAAEYLLELESIAPSAERAGLYEEAGKWLRAAGDDEAAAGCYNAAASQGDGPNGPIGDANLAIDALEAEGAPDRAADLAASYVAEYPTDFGLIRRAARLAAEADRPLVARDLGRQLLARAPDDDDTLREQIGRELAVGDVRAALPLVATGMEKHPDDPRWRQADARVAEWAGAPERALDDWLWLLARGRDRSPAFEIP